MKRLFLTLYLTLFVGTCLFAQEGISVREITPNQDDKGVLDGTYTVKFRDNTVRYLGDDHPNNFTWYLSYKGKRVSDYYYSTATSMSVFSVKAVAWPDAVHKGYEKYVTAQLGKEPPKRDRRDDD